MKKYILLTLGILWMCFIFAQSLLPGSASARQSTGIVEFINPILTSINIHISSNNLSLIIRKLAHFTEFFILGALWFYVYKYWFNRIVHLILVLAHGLLTAIVDESIQYFVEGRSAQVTDVLIDFLGVLIACAMLLFIHLIFNHKSKKNTQSLET